MYLLIEIQHYGILRSQSLQFFQERSRKYIAFHSTFRDVVPSVTLEILLSAYVNGLHLMWFIQIFVEYITPEHCLQAFCGILLSNPGMFFMICVHKFYCISIFNKSIVVTMNVSVHTPRICAHHNVCTPYHNVSL